MQLLALNAVVAHGRCCIAVLVIRSARIHSPILIASFFQFHYQQRCLDLMDSRAFDCQGCGRTTSSSFLAWMNRQIFATNLSNIRLPSAIGVRAHGPRVESHSPWLESLLAWRDRQTLMWISIPRRSCEQEISSRSGTFSNSLPMNLVVIVLALSL